jgi:ArsR family transcriptional regulator, arsenate/arsenite/antimonite-responsive transcriptional repressor
VKNIAQIFKALGDETRIKIIEMLIGRELCVCDILDAFNKSQPVISHHLRTLKQAGLVNDTRDGKWVYYSLNPAAFKSIDILMERIKPDLDKKERFRACLANPIIP